MPLDLRYSVDQAAPRERRPPGHFHFRLLRHALRQLCGNFNERFNSGGCCREVVELRFLLAFRRPGFPDAAGDRITFFH